MRQYLDLLREILDRGATRGDRTGTGTKSLFGTQLRFDLAQGFPLVTTRKVFFKGVIYELLWFLAGDTNIKYLTEHRVHIWDAWADEKGDLGPIYGAQWRSWQGPDGRVIDQISQVVEQIKRNPESRRHIVSAWNPAVLPDERVSPQENVKAGRAALASCHTLFQFYVADGKLSCLLYQRSADTPVGLVFNIAQYSLLTHIMAQQCDLAPGDFIWTGGDCHIYSNQIEGVKEQLAREPRRLPKLVIKRKPASIFEYQFEDFEIVEYRLAPTNQIFGGGVSAPVFLTAEWRYLVMLNFAVGRDVLEPFVPRGTELDWFEGRTFVSVVGFRFLRTRIRGIAIPGHTNFEEVNLRFYVRRKTKEGWRRGVVFVRELVPRRAIAFVARVFYGEPYLALSMRHRIEHSEGRIRAEYAWRRAGRWESIFASAGGEARSIEAGSEEEFITEHYWGYTGRGGGCNEYEVEHSRWRVWRAAEAKFEADVAGLYGERFVDCLGARPTSAFIADGSAVVVRGKARL